jgi:hypothetical protein
MRIGLPVLLANWNPMATTGCCNSIWMAPTVPKNLLPVLENNVQLWVHPPVIAKLSNPFNELTLREKNIKSLVSEIPNPTVKKLVGVVTLLRNPTGIFAKFSTMTPALSLGNGMVAEEEYEICINNEGG